MFCDVVEDHSYTIILEWITNLYTRFENLAFRIYKHTYMALVIWTRTMNRIVLV
jgi:hypothetical protein